MSSKAQRCFHFIYLQWYIEARFWCLRRLNVMHLSSAIPWGGTPGKFNVEWGLIRGFERLTYPGGGGNEGGLFSKSLAPRGKQGTLQTKQVNFKLS